MKIRNWTMLLGMLLTAHAWAAGAKVDNAWARATAPGQDVGGAFMSLTADSDLTLIAAASPAAAKVELHSMRMDGDMMVMRRIDNIALPKGKPIELAPGGLHIMLMGIKAPLKVGDSVPLTLTVRDRAGKQQEIKVMADVREGSGMMMQHEHHHH